jgi:acylpyruvate hydrolase
LVIGRRGRNIPREKAYDYIVGYTILNDVTIRDIFTEDQVKKHGFMGFPEDKAYDATKPFGPYIVTKDEVPDPHNLNLELKLSGRTVLRGNTGDMTILWDIPKIVEHCSRICTLEVGDVIPTGAPGRFPGESDLLKTGDVVEAFVERVGCLRSTVKFEVDVDPSTRKRLRAPELALPNDGNQYT